MFENFVYFDITKVSGVHFPQVKSELIKPEKRSLFMTSRWRNAASQHRDLVNHSCSIFNKHTSDSSVWLVTTLFHHLRFAVIMNLILQIFQRLGCKMTQFIYRLKNYRQFIASLRSNPSPCRHKKWAFFLFTKRAFYFRKSDSIDFGNNA